MKASALSIFIEANRFPPAIDEHQHSIMRAEANAAAARMLTVINQSAFAGSHTQTVTSTNEVYELDANVIASAESSESLEVPSLLQIGPLSPFNPFDEPVASPDAAKTVPDQLRPFGRANSLDSASLPSPLPPPNHLPFITKSAPFDPYKEKYVSDPAARYAVEKYKNSSRLTIFAPSRTSMPVTPSFSSASFGPSEFCVSSVSSDPTRSSRPVSSPIGSASAQAGSAASKNSQRSISYTPPGSPFRIRRKPLPVGVRRFSPSQYPPPGSSSYDSCQERAVTSSQVAKSVSPRPGTTTSNATTNSARHPRVNVQKALPPVPKTDPTRIPVPRHSKNMPRPSVSTTRMHQSRVKAPLNHRAGWEQNEQVLARPSAVVRASSADFVVRPLTAVDRVRGDLCVIKKRAINKLLGRF